MKNILLDVNVIINYLTNDEALQSPVAYMLVDRAVHHGFLTDSNEFINKFSHLDKKVAQGVI